MIKTKLRNLPLLVLFMLLMVAPEASAGELLDLGSSEPLPQASQGEEPVQVARRRRRGRRRKARSRRRGGRRVRRFKRHRGAKGRVESWYLAFNLGYAFTFYGGDDAAAIDTFLQGASRLTPAGDFPGVYFPLSSKMMVGAMPSIVIDRFSSQVGTITISQFLVGPSMQYFFGPVIGQGAFFRGDLGVSWFNLSADLNDGTTGSANTAMGFGALAGVGYAYPITKDKGMRITGGLYPSFRSAEGSTVTSVHIGVGLLL